MSRFNVCIVKLGQDPHVRCFEDFAKALGSALRTLGHEVTSFDKPGRLIMFGANNFMSGGNPMPKDAIIYNAEQVAALREPKQLMGAHEEYKSHVVWDYAQANVERLRRTGIHRAVLCSLGYIPSMSTIEALSEDEEDIDVLFMGSVNARRRKILNDLAEAGLNVVRLFGSYGTERDAYIARSKVCLNAHYYENGVFEIFRCSHLFANRKCVVSESGGQDPDLEALAVKTAVHVPYDELVEACKRLVSDLKARRAVAERGFYEFSKIDLAKNVGRALSESAIDGGGQ